MLKRKSLILQMKKKRLNGKKMTPLQICFNFFFIEDIKIYSFWNRKSENCPETRIQIAKYSQHKKDHKTQEMSPKKSKQELKLFAPDGHPYNINRAKLDFNFFDEQDRYELNLSIYK